jgi:hypothetical protein
MLAYLPLYDVPDGLSMYPRRHRLANHRFFCSVALQPWSNAVLLFVNVDISEFGNAFLEGGRQMTWFAVNLV